MNINERIKYIREDLGMTQAKFADSLGIGQTTVSYIERNGSTVKEQHLRLICKTHRVNYFWLSEEKGEPYIGPPEIIIDEAVEEYGLDDLDKELIEEYVKLKPETRAAIKEYLLNILKKRTPE